MIKIINIKEKSEILSLLESLRNESKHIILIDEYIDVYQDTLEYLKLDRYTYIVDYTNNGYYTNDCRYFGDENISINEWFNNITIQPNIVFEINDLIWLISNFEWENIFDITLNAIIHLDQIKVDTHVLFDFVNNSYPSQRTLQSLKNEVSDKTVKLYLNKLAILSNQNVIFNSQDTKLPNNARTIDKVMFKSKFKLPRWVYVKLLNKSLDKQFKSINKYKKNPNQLQKGIVFLGFDYGYRGNSMYLFEHLIQHKNKYPIYFVTDERKGEYFISPEHSETKHIIEHATVVISESYIPDHLKPNGTIIQLWHGTPIKRLFLDSQEPHQNKNIYNYRARKYNKLTKQDYFITDVETINPTFKSAFPMHNTEMVSCGYPRNRYLMDNINNDKLINELKKDINLDFQKPTILYVPTWRDDEASEYLLNFPKEIEEKFNILYKCHEADKSEKINNDYIDINNFETQQLLLVSDIIISDYSSIIFDALTINQKVYLYTPDYDMYKLNRGIYKDVFESINQNQYFESALLFEAILNNYYKEVETNYINKNNHSYEVISELIDTVMDKHRG
nr:CDP-glycerol glycerophosphotransferase family protein [Mammaliicoccus sp. Marseille-Q6498]